MDPPLTNGEYVESLMEKVKKHDIKYIRLILVDINGTPRAMLIPEYELRQALVYGLGFDGSSIPGFSEVNNSDLHIHPDPPTFMIPMWEKPGVAIMFCYVSRPDGIPFEGDPRGLLKTKMNELEEAGYGFYTGPELEFFYVIEENGKISPFGAGGYFDLPPLDPTEDMKMETMMCLEAAGFQLDKVHHEVAMGQQEINFRYSDALKTADNMILYKLAVKTIAKKHGKIATFMPKPFWGLNGSGCHIHLSLFDLDTGGNLFHEPDKGGPLSEKALHYIGGILRHAKALSLVVAPIVNSYKRLVPNYEAPTYISWGFANRSALVRVPLYPGEKNQVTRIEYRHPDGTCNPYLAATAILSAGMEGINKGIEPPEPFSCNLYHLDEGDRERYSIDSLPVHLGEAVEFFSGDEIVKEALGKYISDNLIESKSKEYENYQKFTGKEWAASRPTITSWEIKRYLNRF